MTWTSTQKNGPKTNTRRSFMKGLGAAASVPFASLILPSYHAKAATPVRGGKLRVSAPVPPELDPVLNSYASVEAASQIADTLTGRTVDGEIVSALIESWEVSEDTRVWTLKVRPGVMWHDGSPFLADAVVGQVNSEDDCCCDGTDDDPDCDPPKKDDCDDGKMPAPPLLSAEKVDDHTVRLEFGGPAPNLQVNLSHVSNLMINRPASKESGKLIGTGAFIEENHSPDSNLVLVANADYWRGRPWLDEVELVQHGEIATAIIALTTGEIDMIPNLPLSKVGSLQDVSDVQITSAPSSQAVLLQMNTGTLADPKVRKAIRFAIDRSAIIQSVYQGYGQVGNDSLVAPIFAEFSNELGVPYDPDSARSLLEEANFVDTGQELSLTYLDSWPNFGDVAIRIVDDLGKVGLRLVLNPVPTWSSFDDEIKNSDLWIEPFRHRYHPFDLADVTVASNAVYNSSGYNNPEVDQLISDFGIMEDLSERRSAVEKFTSIMVEEGPIVEIAWLDELGAARTTVQGFVPLPDRGFDAREIWLET